jgi:hypothetical protein
MPLGMSWHGFHEASIERRACLTDFGFVSTWKEEVLLTRRLGYDRWNELKKCGRMWMVKVAFSAFKGVLGGSRR